LKTSERDEGAQELEKGKRGRTKGQLGYWMCTGGGGRAGRDYGGSRGGGEVYNVGITASQSRKTQKADFCSKKGGGVGVKKKKKDPEFATLRGRRRGVAAEKMGNSLA